jgi:hypothetical protein
MLDFINPPSAWLPDHPPNPDRVRTARGIIVARKSAKFLDRVGDVVHDSV